MALSGTRMFTSKPVFCQCKCRILSEPKLGLSSCCSNCTSDNSAAAFPFYSFFSFFGGETKSNRWVWSSRGEAHFGKTIFLSPLKLGLGIPCPQGLQGEGHPSSVLLLGVGEPGKLGASLVWAGLDPQKDFVPALFCDVSQS